jgi:hypothetical protein
MCQVSLFTAAGQVPNVCKTNMIKVSHANLLILSLLAICPSWLHLKFRLIVAAHHFQNRIMRKETERRGLCTAPDPAVFIWAVTLCSPCSKFWCREISSGKVRRGRLNGGEFRHS